MKRIAILLILMLTVSSCCFAEFSADELKKQGIALYSQNDISGAYKIFLNLDEASRDSEIYLLMGNILQDQNDPIEAIYHFQKAIELDKKNYKAYYNLGNMYLEDNKLNSAISNYQKAIKYKPDFAYAYYNLGICEYKLFDYKNAKKHFVKAMTKKPTEPDFYYNLSLTYTKLGNNEKAKEAMDVYTKLKNEQI